MTINLADNTPRKSYTVSAGSSASSFDTDFEFFVDADLDVFVDGVQKTLATDYTVTGGNGSTGTVTFNSAISAVASDIIVVLTRSIDIERTTDFPTSGPFDIASLNTGLDKIIAIQADLNDSINRSLRLTAYDTDVALTLPDVNTRKGKLLAFNETTGAVEAGATVSGATTIASVAADIQTLADIQDGTTATNAITDTASIASDISLVAAVDGDVTLVAAVDGDVTTVAGQISPTNNISTVAGLATEIGRLGTADAVADMNTLGTADIVTDMDTLADIADDITTVAGKASLITADFVADLNTVAVTDVINDINTLATSDIVSDLNTLATSDIVSDLNTLATTDIVNDINTLATTDIVSDLNLLATSDFVSDLNTMATAQNVSDLNTVAGEISPTNNLATVAGDSDDIQTIADSINAGTFATKANSGANSDITSLTGITGGIDLNGSELILDADGDTSITADTDDQIDFKTNNNDRMVITSLGRVGVGTTSPDLTFHANGGVKFSNTSSSSSSVHLMGSTAETLYFGDSTNGERGGIVYVNSTDLMKFYNNGSDRMVIESDGDVGIGTTSPSARLHVNGGEFTVTDTNNSVLNLTSSTSGNSIINMGDTSDVDEGKIQYTGMTNKMGFHTSANERMTIDSDGDVGIGTTSPEEKLHVGGNAKVAGELKVTGTSGYPVLSLTASTSGASTINLGDTADVDAGKIQYSQTLNTMQFSTSGSVRMHISATGNLGLGTTSPANHITLYTTSSGKTLSNDNTSGTAQRLGVYYGNSTIRDSGKTNNPGINFVNGAVVPAGGSMFYGIADNTLDFGTSSYRWDDIYATNGTIQTSDANLKQQIAPLTDAEITAAKAISALFKTYKWNDSVAEKGDAARTHAGVVAQEVEAAMTAAGLNASDYAFFISTTWWEADVDYPAIEAADAVYDEDGNMVTAAVEAEDAASVPTVFDTAEEAPEGATECNRKGIRYPELLAFIGAATEQRLASIEARLTALEDA